MRLMLRCLAAHTRYKLACVVRRGTESMAGVVNARHDEWMAAGLPWFRSYRWAMWGLHYATYPVRRVYGT